MSYQPDVLVDHGCFWENAYSQNFASLCARARRKLTKGNTFEAEDAVSDAFLRIISKNPESIQSPVSYWWTTIKRVWFDQQTRSDVAKTDYIEDMTPENLENLSAVRVDPRVMNLLDGENSWRAFRLKLGPLSSSEQKLVKARLEGRSFEEIARHMGEDVKRTRFRWYRLRARQRCRLSGEKKRTTSQPTNLN